MPCSRSRNNKDKIVPDVYTNSPQAHREASRAGTLTAKHGDIS